jgi:2'-5' RNA ligase
MNDVKNIRAFLAIDPPAAVRDGIAAIQNRLRKVLTGDIRWTNPTGIHLTLKFFGNISEDDMDTIAAVVGPIAAGLTPLPLDIGTAGFFPDAKRPRILWLGTGGDVNRLVALQASIEDGLAVRGFPKEERSFRPHLTIARIKSPKGLTGASRLAETRSDYRAGSFTAEGVSLFQSTLTPRGAVYTELAKYHFKETTP